MSGWAWRDCPKCGSRTHFGSRCECGGDPWYLVSKAKVELIDAEYNVKEALKTLKYWEYEKERLLKLIINKQKLKCNGT